MATKVDFDSNVWEICHSKVSLSRSSFDHIAAFFQVTDNLCIAIAYKMY